MTKSLKNLSGKWSMDRKASSGVSDVMAIQGFGLFMRKAVVFAPINLTIRQPSDAELQIDQTTTANLPGLKELWYPGDDQWHENSDRLFGKTKTRSRWAKVSDLKDIDERLVEGLSQDDEILAAEAQSVDGVSWTAKHVWCFEKDVFVRRVVVTGKDGNNAFSRLVYHFERE